MIYGVGEESKEKFRQKKKKKESKEKDNPLHQLVVNIKRGINGITDYRVKTVQLHLLVIQNK